MEKQGGRTVQTATEARGARPGRPVLYVLGVGLVLLIVLYGAVYMGFFNFG